MLTTVYTMSFATSLGGLIAWFYYQDQPNTSRWAARLFVGGFGTYLLSLAFADGIFADKLFILFRDFMVLSIVALFFNIIQKHLYVFVAGLVLLYGGFKFGYSKVMQNSFHKLTSSQVIRPTANDTPLYNQDDQTARTDHLSADGIKLAKHGEFLVEVKEHHPGEVGLVEKLFMHGFGREGMVNLAFHPKDGDLTTLDNFYLVDVENQKELKQIETILKAATGIVEYYEYNEYVQLDDPLFSKEDYGIDRSGYYANDPGLNQSWSFQKLDVNQLHLDIQKNKDKPQKNALTANLHTGLDARHEDLQAKYKSIDSKYDNDPMSHGTHCAGIAAAVSNNGKGIASMAPNNDFVEVTSIKVLNSFGGGTQGSIINGILKAADAGADVISMSLGGRSNPSRQRAYDKAVAYANKKGAIVVVAAGNANMNAKNYSPANAKGVITVSATDIDTKRASFSNTVQDVGMGVAAPGVNIYSTTPNNEYQSFNGTSMAAPHVAGLIGLMKSIYPEMTTKDAYFILEKTGINTNDTSKTGKLIQPVQAIDYLTKMD